MLLKHSIFNIGFSDTFSFWSMRTECVIVCWLWCLFVIELSIENYYYLSSSGYFGHRMTNYTYILLNTLCIVVNAEWSGWNGLWTMIKWRSKHNRSPFSFWSFIWFHWLVIQMINCYRKTITSLLLNHIICELCYNGQRTAINLDCIKH